MIPAKSKKLILVPIKCAPHNRNPFLYIINEHGKLMKSEPIHADTDVSERKGREEKRKREMGKKMCG
jgi:hypothetical protein